VVLEAATAIYEYVTGVLGAVRVVSEARSAEPQAVKLMRELGMNLHPEPTPEYPHRIVGVIESAGNVDPRTIKKAEEEAERKGTP
jgi:hypothetical protein